MSVDIDLLAAQVQKLIDRDEVADLLARYCRFLDAMDLVALSELFTEDCYLDFGEGKHMRSHGRAELMKDMRRLWRWERTSHHLSNVEISFGETGKASANSYLISWHRRSDASEAILWGQYRDELERSAVGWRIRRRALLANGASSNFTLKLPLVERRPRPADWLAETYE